jgi:5-formyltetrahydrofolate cyclo-ligase
MSLSLDLGKEVLGRALDRGADEAVQRLIATDLFRRAQVVKVNPDAPQKPVREAVLRKGKLLVMPTPRISRGFLLLDPKRISPSLYGAATTTQGAFRFGTQSTRGRFQRRTS